LIGGLWAPGTDCIDDVHFTDVNAKLNQSKAPIKVLAAHEHEKKKKDLAAFFSIFGIKNGWTSAQKSQNLLKKLSAFCP
jgi:hypothetical protein